MNYLDIPPSAGMTYRLLWKEEEEEKKKLN